MTFAIGYDIWSEDTIEIPNYPTSTYGGRHFEPQSNDLMLTPYLQNEAENHHRHRAIVWPLAMAILSHVEVRLEAPFVINDGCERV